MAGADRMTIEEVVRKVLLDEHADVIREAVKAVAAEMMELEVSELIGAERGERRPDDRATHRNGYRPRRWDTRAGEIELQIPKIRQGSYFPSFLEPRKRGEQALLAVVQQAYVCGVSTGRPTGREPGAADQPQRGLAGVRGLGRARRGVP
jgi:transposase-like protein